MPDTRIFTDASIAKNPGGLGAYFAIITWGSDDDVLKLAQEVFDAEQKATVVEGGLPIVSVRCISGTEEDSTNNRVEMLAAIRAIQALKPGAAATVYSDSAYLVKAVNEGWIRKWQTNGWKSTQGPVANKDLWVELIEAMRSRHISFQHCDGHTGGEDFVSRMNEFCDTMANVVRTNYGKKE